VGVHRGRAIPPYTFPDYPIKAESHRTFRAIDERTPETEIAWPVWTISLF